MEDDKWTRKEDEYDRWEMYHRICKHCEHREYDSTHGYHYCSLSNQALVRDMGDPGLERVPAHCQSDTFLPDKCPFKLEFIMLREQGEI